MLYSCAIFHGKNMYPLSMKFIVVFLCYDEAKKHRTAVVWHFLIGFPIYAILSPVGLSFLCRMLYLFKWCEICTVAYLDHVVPTEIL